MNSNNTTLESLQELSDTERKAIIQTLGQKQKELPSVLQELPESIKKDVREILKYTIENPTTIPRIRYELETYSNDLEVEFSEDFLEKNQKKIVNILDLWAGPWDVTLRAYKKLLSLGLTPQVYALEASSRFRSDIIKNSQEAWVDSWIVQDIWDVQKNTSGIFPIAWNIQMLAQKTLWNVDFIMGNYVLDRVPQKSLIDVIQESKIPFIQFINCIPLQYQNPNTGQSYIPEGEIIIPEGAKNLEDFWTVLTLKNMRQFFGKNTVTSLQDGDEVFEYAGISGQQF